MTANTGRIRVWLAALAVLPALVAACQSAAADETQSLSSVGPWDVQDLASPPKTEPADDYGATGVEAVYFAGEPWRGKPTKVFAYYGLPEAASPQSPVPGVVCIHGGGGTAFASWVRLWNEHGFAAIAIDTNGAVPQAPEENDPDKYRHSWAGPPRYGFDQADWDVRDQWPYHAVAAVIRAHSLLRSLPGVDADRTGVTGISWGGYLTALTIGVDPRFKFAIPVYGCGFLQEGTSWIEGIDSYGRQRWVSLWDPSSYLQNVRLPTLWINGTNDQHYHLPLFQKSYQLTRSPRTLAVRVRMDHGHGSGWAPAEIYAFAKAAVGRGQPLTQVTNQGATGTSAWASYDAPSGVSLESAELNYTLDRGPWVDRVWSTSSALVDPQMRRVTASLPPATTAYYFNLCDNRGLLVSSELVERE